MAATVSPDGRHIAYVGYDDARQGHQQNDLYLADRDGSNVRNLTGDHDRHVQDSARRGGGGPQWAPDGSGVYAVVHDEGNARLVLFSLDGSHRVAAGDIGSGETGYISHNTLWSIGDRRPAGVHGAGSRRAGRCRRRRPGRVRTRAHRPERGPVRRARTRRGGGVAVDFVEGRPPRARLDHQAARVRRLAKVPADPGDTRRPLRGLRRRLRHGEAAHGRRRLRRAVHQPPRQHQLRRGVREPHPPRLPGRRLPRPELGGGPRHRHGFRRRGPAVRDRRQRRRRVDGPG